MRKIFIGSRSAAAFGVGLTVVAGLVTAPEGRAANYQGVMKGIPYATVEFKTGSSVLSESDRRNLHALVTSAAGNGLITKIEVAAWSDAAYPGNDRTLSEADKKLAQARTTVLKDFLKNEVKPASVTTFSMAENSNWLGRTLKSDDADLKSVVSNRAPASPVTHAEYQVIKNEGGPSRAVVVIEH